MKLRELKPAAGSKEAPKRVGRGTGSGLGRNIRKGEEGQSARPSGGVRSGFEGGQIPLYKELLKRGFTDMFAKRYVSINVDRLNILENGTEITPEILFERRVINKVKDGIKILGSRALERSLAAKGCKFSKSAAERIEAAGGKVEMI